MKDVIAWCAAITAFFLIFRTGTGPKTADILLAFTGICVLATQALREIFEKLWPKMRVYAVCFAAIIVFIAIAQAAQYAKTGASPLQPFTLGLYARLAFQAYAFFIAAYLVASDTRLLKWMSIAIFASPVTMLPIYLQPDASWYLSGIRLAGYLKNPIVLGLWMMIALFIGIGLFLDAKIAWKKILIAAWCIVISNFLVWSGTRAAWIAGALGITAWALYMFFRKNDRIAALFILTIPVVTIPIGYIILSNVTRYNQQTQPFIAHRVTTLITDPLKDQTAIRDWAIGVPRAVETPWGIGFATPTDAVPHIDSDTFLEVVLYGGIGALAAFVTLFAKLLFDIVAALKNGAGKTYLSQAWLFAAPAAMSTIVFGDSFFYRLLWVGLGIAAGAAWATV